MTLRALEVLAAVPLVAAEDTRLTKRLLDRHDVDGPPDQLPRAQRPGAAGRVARAPALRGGPRPGDGRGHAGVSDPGADLVAAWAGEHGRVVPIPGASAVLAAVAASGVAGPRWTFEGFLPRSGRERRERLAAIGADLRGAVVYRGARAGGGDAA